MRRPTPRETFIALWVLTQMGLPLHYYLVRKYEDPANEMFSWRMFSDVHHGAAIVEWYRYDMSPRRDDPIGTSLHHLGNATGMSRTWARFAEGGRGHAPPIWLLERIALFLCQALETSPMGIAARRTRIPWHGDVVEEEFKWECG